MESALPQFEGYRTIKKLGSGAYGEVYSVLCLETLEKYAIKVVDLGKLSTVSAIKQAVSESDIHKTLVHPFVNKFHKVFQFGETSIAIVSDLAQGDLAQVVEKYGDKLIPEAKVLLYITQIILGVKYLHDHSVVHRDLKPENVLASGTAEILKLSDFGQVWSGVETTYQTQVLAGTPHYMSPEQFSGQVTELNDVFAIGRILQYLCTKETPMFLDDVGPNYTSDLNDLIVLMQTPNNKKRPTLKEVLLNPLIKKTVHLIIENQIYGVEISDVIRSQVQDLYSIEAQTLSPSIEQLSELSISTSATMESTIEKQIEEQKFSEQIIKKQLKEQFNPSEFAIYNTPVTKQNIIQAIKEFGEFDWSKAPPIEDGQQREIKSVITKNGNKYQGECLKGTDILDGSGVVIWTVDESRYEGQIKNGERHGYGRAIVGVEGFEGNVYEGEYKDDKWHGKGRHKWFGIDKYYEGEWVEGKSHGYGVYKYADGNRYEGQWNNHQRHGEGTLYYKDGAYQKGNYVNGKEHGCHTYYQIDGNVEIREYVDGELVQ